MGAKSKHSDWDLRCYQMGYIFIPLAIGMVEDKRQAEVTEAPLCRLIDIADCGDTSDF